MNIKEIKDYLQKGTKKKIRIVYKGYAKDNTKDYQELEIFADGVSYYKRTWTDGGSAGDRLIKDALIHFIKL